MTNRRSVLPSAVTMAQGLAAHPPPPTTPAGADAVSEVRGAAGIRMPCDIADNGSLRVATSRQCRYSR